MIKPKKYKGNITTTLIIFIFALILFSICAIDAGYVITARYKSQKITETLALYMVSALKAAPIEERTVESLDEIKEKFQNLYTNIDNYHNFKITNIELKDTDTNPKIKIKTITYAPTLFLKYAGIGLIKVLQTSYAASEEYDMPVFKTDENSYTFKTPDIITDKNGDDIKIDFKDDYFIFAGLEDDEGNIRWAEIGSITENSKTKYKISNGEETFDAYCIGKGSAAFDFSKDESKTIGLVKYIKIYKTNCSETDAPEIPDTETPETEAAPEIETPETPETPDIEEETETPDAETPDTEEETKADNPPVVTILNSVKLIKRDSF